MIEFTLRHELDCTVDRHWELFFDHDWTYSLLTEGLGFAAEIGPVKQEGGARKRQMDVKPEADMPKAVAKLLGDALGYTERGSYDEATRTWTYDLVLNVLTDKIRMGGKVHLEPLGDDRCTRVSQMYAEAKIFGIGGLVEKAAEKNMRDGWTKSANWINGWLAKNPNEG